MSPSLLGETLRGMSGLMLGAANPPKGGTGTTDSPVQLFRGILAHLVIQGAYIVTHFGHPIICERRVWYPLRSADGTSAPEFSQTIRDLLSAIRQFIDGASGGGPGLRELVDKDFDFSLYVLDQTTRGPGRSILRFDILDLATREAYEIKSGNPTEIEEGRIYLKDAIKRYNNLAALVKKSKGYSVQQIRPGLWNPPKRLPTGIKSWIEVRRAEPGLIVYKPRPKDEDDDTIEELRSLIAQQKVINTIMITLGAIVGTAALIYGGIELVGGGAAGGTASGGTVIEMSVKTAGEAASEELFGQQAAASLAPLLLPMGPLPCGGLPPGTCDLVKKAAGTALEGLSPGTSDLVKKAAGTALDLWLGKYRPAPFRQPRFSYPPVRGKQGSQGSSAETMNASVPKGSPLASGNVVPVGGESGGFLPGPGEFQPSQDFPRAKKLAEDLILLSPDCAGHGDSAFDDEVEVFAHWFDTMARNLGGIANMLQYLGLDSNINLDDDDARMEAAQKLNENSQVGTVMTLFDWLSWAPLQELQDMLPQGIQPDGSIAGGDKDIKLQ